MMGYNYGQMMGYGGGWMGSLGLLTWLIWLAAGILLVVWLWQQVTKK